MGGSDARLHDIYTAEGIGSIVDFGYLRKEALPADAVNLRSASDSNRDGGTFYRSSLSLRQIRAFVDNQAGDPEEAQVDHMEMGNSSDDTNSNEIDRRPRVYLTDSSELNLQVAKIIEEFHLNEEQAFAFKILAHHSMSEPQPINVDQRASGQPSSTTHAIFVPENQLLMGMFGEGSTGKSRVI